METVAYIKTLANDPAYAYMAVTEVEVEAALAKIAANGEEASVENVFWTILLGIRTPAEPLNPTWADAPLHKQIAAAMGMDDGEAEMFYLGLGKDC